ncbi:helix-turn-helix transcriptional regulator [Saccharothrix sp. AJ9571]|nr:helix-turn-helix transcriptional regulator [Saccharothrix sp. AJ9571]
MSEIDHDMQNTTAGEEGESFAVLLRRLISLHKHHDGRAYSVSDLAKDLEHNPRRISRAHLYNLANGTNEPSLEAAQTLADHFGVELGYFDRGARGRALRDQYARPETLSRQQVQEVTLRASKLSSEQLRTVLDYIDFQSSRQGAAGNAE